MLTWFKIMVIGDHQSTPLSVSIRLVGIGSELADGLHLIQPALVAPCKEPLPIPVELDTAKMQQTSALSGIHRMPLQSSRSPTNSAPLPRQSRRDHHILVDQSL